MSLSAILINTALVAASAVADRLRGYGKPVGWGGAKKFVAGGVLGLCLGLTGLPLLLAAVLIAVGFSWGWGAPLGALLRREYTGPTIDGEWWQVGILRRDSRLAMFARGLMAGAVTLPLTYFLGAQALWLLPLFGLSYLLAPLLTTDWKIQENIRGALLAISCLII